MMPGYFESRRGTNMWGGQTPPGYPPMPFRDVPQELTLVYTEPFRRDLVELNEELYSRAVQIVLGLPARHLNDPQRVLPRDSRVCTIEDESGLTITYLVVLSLAELIVARLEYTAPAV